VRFLLALVRPERVWTLELGAGLDRVVIDPGLRAGSTVRPRARGTSDRPSLGLALAHFWYAGDVRFGVGLAADLMLVRASYDVVVDQQSRRELTPWPVQPGAFAGVAFH